MLKLSYISEYIMLAELLSFTKTAESLFMSQPALSKHVAIIEEDMGAKLFERDTKHVILTPAGKTVYDSFKNIIQIADDTRLRVHALATGKVGSLRISSPYYWSEDYVDPIVLSFSETNPLVDVQVVSCQPEDGGRDVLEGKSDLTVAISRSDIPESIKRFDFATERIAALMNLDHPLADRETITLAELVDNAAIFLDSNDVISVDTFNNWRDFILALMAKRDFEPTEIYYTQQVDTLGISIQKTGAVSIMPYCVRNMNRSYLTTVLISDADCVVPMSYYYRNDNYNAAIPLFLNKVHEAFS